MVLVPPQPQVLDRPGTIRWAVGSPVGPRSHTWSVVGHPNTNDVFVGIRDHMHVMKLSLHESKWRMALTKEAAAQHLPPDTDRVVTRWNQPGEMAQGWRHAACIIVTASNMGHGYPEKRVKRGRVSWFPAPEYPFVIRFDVMLKRPDAEPLTVGESLGEVGRMTMRSGAGVWIVGTEFATTTDYEARMANLRSEVMGSVPEGTAKVRGWAWGEIDEGVPQLVDLSGVDARTDSPR